LHQRVPIALPLLELPPKERVTLLPGGPFAICGKGGTEMGTTNAEAGRKNAEVAEAVTVVDAGGVVCGVCARFAER